MADILDMLEEAEWTAPQGRGEVPSPYLPAVQRSVDEGYKAFAFPVTLNGKNPVEQDKDLTKHLNLLRKAGRQTKPEPVTVLVQPGDVNRKTGEVRITFKTREKITRKAEQSAA